MEKRKTHCWWFFQQHIFYPKMAIMQPCISSKHTQRESLLSTQHDYSSLTIA